MDTLFRITTDTGYKYDLYPVTAGLLQDPEYKNNIVVAMNLVDKDSFDEQSSSYTGETLTRKKIGAGYYYKAYTIYQPMNADPLYNLEAIFNHINRHMNDNDKISIEFILRTEDPTLKILDNRNVINIRYSIGLIRKMFCRTLILLTESPENDLGNTFPDGYRPLGIINEEGGT